MSGLALAAGFSVGRQRRVPERGAGRLRAHADRRGSGVPSVPAPSYRELHDVLQARRFRSVFQPVFGLRDGRLLAVEALTRFERLEVDGAPGPARPPDVWFRRAGELGLGVELELAAMDVALRSSADLPVETPLSLNASPATLVDARLEPLLGAHEGRNLVLEVTEHAVVGDYPALERAVGRLRARGHQLAVDDAGAGFASLQHVVRLAPDVIKLDASLTQGIEHDAMRRALAASLVLFSRRTGSQLIAEGIERLDDLTAWQDLGADGAQGYLLARPGPLQAWDTGPTLLRDAHVRVN